MEHLGVEELDVPRAAGQDQHVASSLVAGVLDQTAAVPSAVGGQDQHVASNLVAGGKDRTAAGQMSVAVAGR